MDLNQKLMNAFQIEHLEHLARIRSMLLALEQHTGPCAGPELDEAFRCAHSLKGAARIIGVKAVEMLAHRLESLFARLRAGELAWEQDAISVVHLALDGIEDAAAAAIRGDDPADPTRIVAELDRLLDSESTLQGVTTALAEIATAIAEQAAPALARDAESLSPNSRSLGMARQIDSVRLSTKSLDRLLKCSGQLLTSCLQQDVLSRELQGLNEDIGRLQKDRKAARFLATTNECGEQPLAKGLAGQTAQRTTDRLLGRSRIGQRGSALEHQLLALGKRARAIAQIQCSNAWSHRRLAVQLREDVCRARLVPAEDIFQSFRKMMRDLAQDQGKQVDFTIEGINTEADRTVLQALKDPLMHVLRNAICHGIELPDERVGAGKLPQGTVLLRVEASGNRLLIAVEDDGRGVDLIRVTESAVRQGFVSDIEAQSWSPEELLHVLVRPGFTTCDAVNELAGRGLGLSVAYETVTGLQGEMAVRPRQSAGTLVSISVPLAISTHRILLVSYQGQTFGIPLAGIESVRRVERRSLESLEGRPMVSLAGQLIPIFTLGHLLKLGDTDGLLDTDTLQIVVLKAGLRRIAVVVETLILERSAVIQRLDPPIAQLARFAGGMIQEDGSVSLVLNPVHLIESSNKSTRPACFQRTKVEKAPAPKILLVDDSFTTRTLETNILEAHGYQVRIAIDGIEALNHLRTEHVDLVISDVQMPHLDGFGLLAEMKQDQRLAHIPVIIVSSMDRREDQERGLALGADAYLVKQKFDHQHLLKTIQQIV